MKNHHIINNNIGNNIHQSKRISSHVLQNNNNSKVLRPNSEQKLCTFQHTGRYGFQLTGGFPVVIKSVSKESSAWKSGLRERDIILKVNDIVVKDKDIQRVTSLIKAHSIITMLVKSQTRNALSAYTPSSQIKIPDSITPKMPMSDQNGTRRSSVTKPIPKAYPQPKPRTVSDGVTARPVPHQPIRHNSNSTKKEVLNHRKSVDTSSSSSSQETSSDSVKSVVIEPSKPLHNHSPEQSKSYNEQTIKKRPPPPPILKAKPVLNPALTTTKYKTIPATGEKSVNHKTMASNDNIEHSKLSSHHHTLPKQTSDGRILGREFDDSDDESDNGGYKWLTEMLKSFKDSLSKPGIVSILLGFVNDKFEDMKIMMLFFACKLYKSLKNKQEFQANAPRIANEIISTFLHVKSPLFIEFNNELIGEAMKNLQLSDQLKTIFDSTLSITFERLEKIVCDVRGKLERGIPMSKEVLTSINSFQPTMNHEMELKLLYRTISNIFINSHKDSNFNDKVLATQIGLATMYQYFDKSKDTVLGTGIKATSGNNINKNNSLNRSMTISDFFKIDTLCSMKSLTNFKRKYKTVCSHVLTDTFCLEPTECVICKELLWGVSPQGLSCTMCGNHYHIKCKKNIKNMCLRKSRKSISLEEKPPFIERLIRRSSSNSNKSPQATDCTGNKFFGSSTIIQNDKTDNNTLLKGHTERSKSYSVDQLHRNTNVNGAQFERTGSGFNVNHSIVNGAPTFQPGVVQVHELVTDEYLDDADMNIDESFDADTELHSVFPNMTADSDKRILIVLLEFYHKTKYILMNLTRLWHSIVKKWPPSQNIYIKTLSLDSIEPLKTLIKSLVLAIKDCVSDQEFVGLEQVVLKWLTQNNDDHLKTWLSLSSNLSCTNSLDVIKQLKQNTLSSTLELIPLLNLKFKKRVIIDDLAQIRPLLISLPLIAKNIIKSLTKEEARYTEEIFLWKQISVKLDYLCEYIDTCCIPLVNRVNNGTIFKRPDRSDGLTKWKDEELHLRDFYNEFPKTLFHNQIYDFQISTIFDWSTNTLSGKMSVQTTYLKKGTEVLVILYKTFIVILQKENDHYVLKPVKSTKAPFEKTQPFIIINNDDLFRSGGQEENMFVLNVISNKNGGATLLRIGFSRQEILDNWLDCINTKEYNLARSISLFKSNDFIVAADSGSFYERIPSTNSSRFKSTIDSVDNSMVPRMCSEMEDKSPSDAVERTETSLDNTALDEKEEDDCYATISRGLTNAFEALDLKTALCAMLNVSEDKLTSKIQTIKEDGVKSIEELFVVMFLLSQSTIQQTRQILAKCCSKVVLDSEFDVDQTKKMFTSTCDLLDKWDKPKELISEICPEVTVQLRTTPRRSNYNSNREDCITFIKSIGNVSEDDEETYVYVNTSDNSVNQINRLNANRVSYVYDPSESQLPSIDCDKNLNAEIVPLSENCQLSDEIITVTRAQIVLPKKKL